MWQGCIFAPDLFNLSSNVILKDKETLSGFIISKANRNYVGYVDDNVLIADT